MWPSSLKSLELTTLGWEAWLLVDMVTLLGQTAPEATYCLLAQ